MKLFKTCKKPEQYISAIALKMQRLQPDHLKVSVIIKTLLPEFTGVNEQIGYLAENLVGLVRVSLKESVEPPAPEGTSCIKHFFNILVRPSFASLKHLKLKLESEEVGLDILERLQETQLETLHISISKNIGRFRGAF